jgi:sigma-E factor negative regulatory protein RseA
MKDQISALMDDELDVDASDHLFQALHKDRELNACWSTYHLIGDAMRGNPEFSADFEQRLLARIEAEPTVFSPKRRFAVKPTRMMSLAASVAAVMFVGWMVLQQQARSPSQDIPAATLAQGNVTPGSVDAYLLAHQEFSPETGMQPSYYISPASFSESSR